jgi:hypothetical protein
MAPPRPAGPTKSKHEFHEFGPGYQQNSFRGPNSKLPQQSGVWIMPMDGHSVIDKENTMNPLLLKCLPIAALLVSLLPAAAAQPGSVTLEVLNPMGVIDPPKTFGLSPRVADLAGKKIALMHNNKPGASNLLDALQDLLKRKYPDATFPRGYQTNPVQPPKDPDMYKKAAAESDAFVFAMGD